jgi:hypothetical protein
MNTDWIDLLRELNAAGARYLLVGAHAVGVHGLPRATRDIDIWVDPSPGNAELVWRVLARFGAPLADLGIAIADLLQPDNVLQIGVPPNRIDLMTSLSGLPDFASAWERRYAAVFESENVPVLGLADLLVNKEASGRDRDRADVRELRSLQE